MTLPRITLAGETAIRLVRISTSLVENYKQEGQDREYQEYLFHNRSPSEFTELLL